LNEEIVVFFKNKTVKKSIITGYIIALCLMLAIGGVAIFQLQQINSTVTNLVDNLVQEQHIADTIISQAFSVRFFANRYIANRQADELINYENALANLDALLKQADVKIIQAEHIKILNRIKESVSHYKKIFEQIKAIIQNRSDIITHKINIDGEKIEQKLNQLIKIAIENQEITKLADISELQSSLLLIRVNAIKYLEQGQQQWFDEFEKHYQKVQTVLTRLIQQSATHPQIYQLLQTIKTTSENYHLNFTHLKTNFIEQQQLITQQLDTIGPKIREMATQISSYVALDFVSVNQTTHALVANTQWGIITILFASILICLGLGLAISRNIMVKLGGEPNEVAAIAEKITAGELNFDLGSHKSGLLGSMQIMHQQLRQRIEKDKKVADEALRINNALDNVTTSVLIADAHYNVIYLNKAAVRLFKKIETHIRAELPHFNANNLLNHTIDTLYKNPQQHREMLAALTTSQQSSLDIKGITIDYTATPIRNTQGEWLGVVKEFTDRTIEIVMEQEIASVIHYALQGNFEQHINLDNKTGFFKIFSENMNQMIVLTKETIEEIMILFAALAQGNLNKTIERTYAGTFEKLKNDANSTVQKLTEIMTTIKQTAEIVSNAATEISQGNLSLSQRTEEQAASLQQTAASVEQIASTIKQNADNSIQARQLALTARTQAEEGGRVVGQAISTMVTVNESSKKITDIISVIDGIAFQTNLLALNAAVEAARAGEQGRGFAVVAAEVRNLAQRSATAAREIKQLIQNSVDKVEAGTKAVERSGKTLEDIIISVKKVSDVVTEIATATQEQSAGIEQINHTINQMDEMTQQNAALVEQAASASESMLEQAQNLNQQVSFFSFKETSVKTNTSPIIKHISRQSKPMISSLYKPNKSEQEHGEWIDF